MSTYNPQSHADNQKLADKLATKLHQSGFHRVSVRGFEEVYERKIQGPVSVRVYTTIDTRTGVVRGCGKDAIRICAVSTNKEGETRGLAKFKRVNRAGDMDAIVTRTLTRMREAWVAGRGYKSCSSCGSVMWLSKAGKPYCSDLCWKN